MLSTLLSGLGEALGSHNVQLWLELQSDEIYGNEQQHRIGCICPICSSIHKEEEPCVPLE